MRRLPILLVAVALGTGVAVSEAAGGGTGGTHYKTTIDATGTTPAGGSTKSHVFIEFGRVHSPAAACKGGRSMEMVGHLSAGGQKVLDVGRSSRNSAYALDGNFTGVKDATITAARKVIGSGPNRKICDAGSVGAD